MKNNVQSGPMSHTRYKTGTVLNSQADETFYNDTMFDSQLLKESKRKNGH